VHGGAACARGGGAASAVGTVVLVDIDGAGALVPARGAWGGATAARAGGLASVLVLTAAGVVVAAAATTAVIPVRIRAGCAVIGGVVAPFAACAVV